MEVEWWMPCFVELANCFSILMLWLLGTSNKLVGGCDCYLKVYFYQGLYHYFALEESITP